MDHRSEIFPGIHYFYRSIFSSLNSASVLLTQKIRTRRKTINKLRYYSSSCHELRLEQCSNSNVLHWKTESHAVCRFSSSHPHTSASTDVREARRAHLNRFTIQKSRSGSQFRILRTIVTAEKLQRAPRRVAANKRCLACLLTMKSVQPPPEAGTMDPRAAECRGIVFYVRITARLWIDRYKARNYRERSSLLCRGYVDFERNNYLIVEWNASTTR